jgi:RNA 3'-phosphate cyclase
MIVLDGSYGEGGGQMLRTALVLSLLTGQPFRIEKIRSGRSQPGLKPQHAHILKALLMMSDSSVDTVQPGALAVTFQPGPLRGGHFQLDVGTAGAIPLVLQTVLPVALFAPAPVSFTISGGTDVRGTMSMDFWQLVLLPFLQPYAEKIELTVQRRGFYPKGGGLVLFHAVPVLDQTSWATKPSTAPALTIPERGEFRQLRIASYASRELRERQVATRQAAACQNRLPLRPVDVDVAHVETFSPGSVITAVAEYEQTRLGADALGERGKPSERVGQDAANKLKQEIESGATVDVHTADNLMIWVALFGGGYTFAEPTGHITTNAWVIEHFLPGALHLAGNSVAG